MIKMTSDTSGEARKSIAVASDLIERMVKEDLSAGRQALIRSRSNGTVDGGEAASAPQDAVSIERENMRVRLNGYETSRPFGKQASEVEVALFSSNGSREILDGFRDAVGRVFPGVPVVFHTLAFLLFSVIRDIMPLQKDFLIVDVLGEITDVTIVKEGIIERTLSFPLGRNALVRRLTDELQSFHGEALSTVRLYRAGKLEADASARFESILSTVRGEWNDSFGQSLARVSRKFSLPNRLFMVGDADTGPLFASFVSPGVEKSDSPGESQFFAQLLGNDFLSKYSTMPPGKGGDVFLDFGAIFVDKLNSKLINAYAGYY
jgi:hypothetical protein